MCGIINGSQNLADWGAMAYNFDYLMLTLLEVPHTVDNLLEKPEKIKLKKNSSCPFNYIRLTCSAYNVYSTVGLEKSCSD